MRGKSTIIAAVIAMAVASFAVRSSGEPQKAGNPGGVIRIVAAENFYGNVAGQLGGNKVAVKSIISNPDIDPHEYEPVVDDGIAAANANILVKNGLEYDTWMDRLISASPNPGRTVITAGGVAPNLLPGNPHVWYGIENIKAVAGAVAAALEKTDRADAAVFKKNLAAFNGSLAPILAKMAGIKSRYAGTPVALTETIYLYQSRPMGLRVLTPFNFEKAIAEGNDPAASDIAAAFSQIRDKKVKVLIYNSQTVTPVTTNLLKAAAANGIPVVSVTETMPAGATYQSWMLGELNALEKALASATRRH